MTIQNALPPYSFRCLACGHEWTPERTTDGGLQRESEKHLKECDTPIAVAPREASQRGAMLGSAKNP